MRTREVHREMPRLSGGRAFQQVESVLADPVVAIRRVRQWRRERVVVFLAAAEVRDMFRGEAFAMQIGHVGTLGRHGAAAHGVALALVVDAVGKSPFGKQALAVESPVFGRFVQIEFAASRDVIARRVPQQAIVRLPVDREVSLVVDHTAAVVFATRREARARRRTQWRCDDGASERRAAAAQRVDVRSPHRDARRAATGPVEAKLIREQQQNVRGPSRRRPSSND